MSELAKSYYEDRVNRLDLSVGPPPALNGEPISLLGPDEGQIPLHMPERDPAPLAAERYGVVLASLHPFLLATLPFQNEHGQPDNRTLGNNQRHINNLIATYLRPRNFRTGNLTDIQTEAIAGPEVAPTLLTTSRERIGRHQGGTGEDNEAYLLTSAAYRAGSKVGYCACLTMVYPFLPVEADSFFTLHYVSKALSSTLTDAWRDRFDAIRQQ